MPEPLDFSSSRLREKAFADFRVNRACHSVVPFSICQTKFGSSFPPYDYVQVFDVVGREVGEARAISLAGPVLAGRVCKSFAVNRVFVLFESASALFSLSATGGRTNPGP